MNFAIKWYLFWFLGPFLDEIIRALILEPIRPCSNLFLLASKYVSYLYLLTWIFYLFLHLQLIKENNYTKIILADGKSTRYSVQCIFSELLALITFLLTKQSEMRAIAQASAKPTQKYFAKPFFSPRVFYERQIIQVYI